MTAAEILGALQISIPLPSQSIVIAVGLGFLVGFPIIGAFLHPSAWRRR